jgi:hypothetical protein
VTGTRSGASCASRAWDPGEEASCRHSSGEQPSPGCSSCQWGWAPVHKQGRQPAPTASSSASSASSAPATSPTEAQLGAGWLGRDFHGSHVRANGANDPGSTAEAVLAFAASGVGGSKASAAMGWLKKNFESYVRSGKTDDAGALATVILAAQAMGIDPTHFGGKKKANNLVTRLIDSQRTTGPDAGLFGPSDPTYDGAFRQGLSLAALANQGISSSNPVMEAGVTWLQNQQCSDGGWESYRPVEIACTPPDPEDFTGPDTNSTALAVMGLVAAGATFPSDPTAFFASAQNSDGGFELSGTPSPGSSDPDSTAEVIQALVALNELSASVFTQTGGTPLTALASFQLGCSAGVTDDGAYVFPGEDGPNLLATLQAVPAAAEMAFPFTPGKVKSALLTLKCPAA